MNEQERERERKRGGGEKCVRARVAKSKLNPLAAFGLTLYKSPCSSFPCVPNPFIVTVVVVAAVVVVVVSLL